MRNCLGRSFAIAAITSISIFIVSDAVAQEGDKAPAPTVTVVKVSARDVRPSISFTGRVEATDKVELRARIDGFLEQQLFTEGQDVKKGDLLFVIEQGSYQASVEEAKAAIESAEAALALANIEVTRQSALVAKDAAARSLLDLANAKQRGAQATLSQTKATLDKAELQLGYTEIRAPIAGRIGRSQYSVGNFVSPSSGVLATIVSQDPIDISFSISQREILAIRARQGGATKTGDAVVHAQLADGTRYPQPGKINFVDVTTSQGTDTVQVRASFPNPDRVLIDGQLVNVILEGSAPETKLVVPQAATQIDQTGPYVLVVNKDNKIEVRHVELGTSVGTDLVVTKGLTDGEMVVTEGIQKVRPGQAVEPVEAKSGL